MRITEITENKRQYMDLLLLADEQEDMVERYLDRGTMYALEDRGAVRAVCVVTGEGDPAIDALVLRRAQAKKAKDFAQADSIREELRAMGVEVVDTKEGAAWKRV